MPIHQEVPLGTNIKIGEYNLSVFRGVYPTGTGKDISVAAFDKDGMPFTKLSQNILIGEELGENEFAYHPGPNDRWKDDWLACGLFEDTGKRYEYGNFGQVAEIWRIK